MSTKVSDRVQFDLDKAGKQPEISITVGDRKERFFTKEAANFFVNIHWRRGDCYFTTKEQDKLFELIEKSPLPSKPVVKSDLARRITRVMNPTVCVAH